jgi:hypothetical protein
MEAGGAADAGGRLHSSTFTHATKPEQIRVRGCIAPATEINVLLEAAALPCKLKRTAKALKTKAGVNMAA